MELKPRNAEAFKIFVTILIVPDGIETRKNISVLLGEWYFNRTRWNWNNSQIKQEPLMQYFNRTRWNWNITFNCQAAGTRRILIVPDGIETDICRKGQQSDNAILIVPDGIETRKNIVCLRGW